MKWDLPEPKKPDTHTPMRAPNGRVVGVLGSGQVGIEELAQVFGDLLGGDVFIQLLPDAFGIALVALMTPLMGRLMGLANSCWMFIVVIPGSGSEPVSVGRIRREIR